MLIEHTLFGTIDKVQIAIDRLKAFEPKDMPYWLAFSGGKDSCVILELAKMAGVRFEAHYNVTSVDPPELVRFVKKVHPEVSFDIPHDKNGKPISMWSLLKSKSTPPTRTARYCCEKLKESSGKGTITITGVRWAESIRRRENQGIVVFAHKNASRDPVIAKSGAYKAKKGGMVLNDDNDESRRTVEVCFRTHKTIVNPIIDWLDEDVWEFIHKYNVLYCELYDEGFERLGCIGCPLATLQNRKRDFERYPKYEEQYRRCFDEMYRVRVERGLNSCGWNSGQDIFNWWMGDMVMTNKENCSLLEMEDEP